MTESYRMAASVRQRLKNLAGAADFQMTLLLYVLERLLYRLSQSDYRSQFVLKGALLFNLWSGLPSRATRDMDLLGFGESTPERITQIFRELCVLPVAEDGLEFVADSVGSSRIKPDQEYEGVRITLVAYLAGTRTRVAVQVDVGFGDAITPAPVILEFPPLLDFPAPHLLSYPRETVVAEKFQAMVILGLANTRMKDFYDLWRLATDFDFDGAVLGAALKATFDRRRTKLPESIDEVVALASVFVDSPLRQQAWRAFLRKNRLVLDLDLVAVMALLEVFLLPVSVAMARDNRFFGRWNREGRWD